MALKTKWLISKEKSCSCTMPGVWRAVSYCRGCAVIFHSPRGCAHVASTMDVTSQFRDFSEGGTETMEPVPLISSDMRERDGIFGGTDRLRRCIRYTAQEKHPQCILIASSCVAGVIGDDVEAEAREAEEELGIPVVAVNGSGFLGGEYGDGYFAAAQAVISRFFKRCPKKAGTVLFLGDNGGPWGPYAREAGRLLSCFGLRTAGQFPGFVPFSEWDQIPSASLSVILGGWGQASRKLEDMADLLERDFDVPCLGHVYPIGWSGTVQWIRRVGEVTGQPGRAESLVREEESRLHQAVASMRRVTEGKTAVIGIGRSAVYYDPADTVQMLRHMGIKTKAVIFYDNVGEQDRVLYRKELEKEKDIPVLSMGDDGQKAIDGSDVLLTTHEILNICTRQLFIPMISPVGISGEIAFMKALYRLLCRYGRKGGMAYV